MKKCVVHEKTRARGQLQLALDRALDSDFGARLELSEVGYAALCALNTSVYFTKGGGGGDAKTVPLKFLILVRGTLKKKYLQTYAFLWVDPHTRNFMASQE